MSESRHDGDTVSAMIRLPRELHAQVKADAAANGRSMNTEIVMRLGGIAPTGSRANFKMPVDKRRAEIALTMLPVIAKGMISEGLFANKGDNADRAAAQAFAYADAFLATPAATRKEGGADHV